MLLLFLLPCADPSALTGHTGWVGAVAFSADGKRLATASADRTVRTWRADATAIDTLKGHTDTACAVAFLGDGLVSAGHDGTVRLWRMGGSKTLETRRGAVLSVAATPDGKIVAAGGIDGVITLHDPSGGKETRLTGHKSWVNALTFRPDGKRLASASSDGTVRLWDAAAKELIGVYELPDPREIRGVALSPDGKFLAAAVRFGTVHVWDVASRKVLASEKAHDGEAWSVCFSPDSRTLVSGGGDWGKPGTVKLWDTATWKAKATLTPAAEVLSVAVSPDGRWLAAAGMGRTVWLWDLRVSGRSASPPFRGADGGRTGRLAPPA
jgi:WD40 repeat protein